MLKLKQQNERYALQGVLCSIKRMIHSALDKAVPYKAFMRSHIKENNGGWSVSYTHLTLPTKA